MVDAARQMLDELMGRNRNLHPSEAGLKVNWEDPEFCQFYNVKFCPHDLFINTRADLGPCARIHDDEAKHLYSEARPSQRKRQYEDEFLRFCNVMLHDVDRKIQKGKQRLQLMQSDQPASHIPIQISKYQEHLNKLNARIKKLLSEAEEAGIRGDVDQAQDLMTICEELREEKEALQNQNETSLRSTATLSSVPPASEDWSNDLCEKTGEANDSGSVTTNASTVEGTSGIGGSVDGANTESNEAEDSASDDNDKKSQTTNWSHDLNVPEKQMKVCDICGAFLIVGDAQQRIEDHLMGKQHLGYSKLRNAVAEINEKRQREREDEERRRRDERTQRGNAFDSRRSSEQRDFRERSREHSSSSSSNRHHSDKHRYHHKSHHRNAHSHNSRSRNHQHYRHDSRDRYSRSRSRSRY